MVLQNHKTAIMVRFRTFVLTIIFVCLIIVIYTTRLLDAPLFGLHKNYITAILAGIFILILLIQYFLNLSFISYSDEGPNLILRYYSLRILSSKKNSIEIPKNEFVRFEVIKTSLGLKRELYLYQRVRSGIAKYPPIPITSLTKDERTAIHNSLSRYVK
jgi:hypothetical protein